MAWGSNVPQTRTPDAHFFTEVRYKGAKTVAVTPDYSKSPNWPTCGCTPNKGTDAAVAMAMGHVILKEFYFDKRSPISTITPAATPTCPAGGAEGKPCPTGAGAFVPDRYVRAAISTASSTRQQSRLEDRGLGENGRQVALPNGSIGFRWGPRTARPGQVEPGGQGRARQHRQAQAVGDGRDGDSPGSQPVAFRISVASRPAFPAQSAPGGDVWSTRCR